MEIKANKVKLSLRTSSRVPHSALAIYLHLKAISSSPNRSRWISLMNSYCSSILACSKAHSNLYKCQVNRRSQDSHSVRTKVVMHSSRNSHSTCSRISTRWWCRKTRVYLSLSTNNPWCTKWHPSSQIKLQSMDKDQSISCTSPWLIRAQEDQSPPTRHRSQQVLKLTKFLPQLRKEITVNKAQDKRQTKIRLQRLDYNSKSHSNNNNNRSVKTQLQSQQQINHETRLWRQHHRTYPKTVTAWASTQHLAP